MTQRVSAVLFSLLLIVYGGQTLADEGMWQPELLPAIANQLTSRGLALEPESLTDLVGFPMGAIVGLGFCTGSFVSPQGLIVTNHHCAYGAIQYNSTEDENLLRDGFVARKTSDDRPGNPALRVYVTEEIQPVTDQVTGALSAGMTGKERFDAIDAAKKRLVAECEKGGDVRCDVYTFYGGAEYRLIRQLEVRDVRLVYAPPLSVGRYGGEVDNWVWPRHTGDFSFFRAYVGPDGRPADPSEENVPFRPSHYLKVNPAGLREGDFAMALGYPGSTSRYALATEVEYAVAVDYPSRIESIDSWLKVIDENTRDRPDAALKYASRVASLNNGLKNYRGMLDGFAAVDVPTAKRAMQRVSSQDADAGRAIERLRKSLQQWYETRESERLYSAVRARGLLGAARALYRLSVEREKPDLERAAGYQERDWQRRRDALEQLERRFDPLVDRELLFTKLLDYAQLPQHQRQQGLDQFFGIRGESTDTESILKQLDVLFDKTQLVDTAKRLDWFDKTPQEFEASTDPFIALAVAMSKDDLALEAAQQARQGDIERSRAAYMAALLKANRKAGVSRYDDANNSLRVTYGTVVGYSPQDAVDLQPFTSLAGIVEKDTGESPFDAPAALLDAIAAERLDGYASEDLDTVPVNFLTNLDVTGGNSGSPTLDANAQLVGLVFDGNYESINADWWFNERLTRTIHVDIRYMLWVMDIVSGAQELLAELGVPAKG